MYLPRATGTGRPERPGYTVLEAASAEAAIQFGERHQGPTHLLLTDVVMPAQGGGQLADRLRRTRPEIRILFMSGHPDDAVVRGVVVQSGAFYFPHAYIDCEGRWRILVADVDAPIRRSNARGQRSEEVRT